MNDVQPLRQPTALTTITSEASITDVMFDMLPQHIALLDHTGRIIKVNKSWRKFAMDNAGTTDRLCEGMNYLEICELATGPGSDGAAEFASGLRAVLQGESNQFSIEYPCDSPDEQRWFVAHITSLPGDSVRRAMVLHENVTPQKKAEEALFLSEIKILEMFQNLPVGVYRSTSEGRLVDANPALVKMLGYPDRETLVNTKIEDLYFDLAERDRRREILVKEDILLNYEIRLRRYDGSTLWALDHVRVVRNPEGKILYTDGVLEDISQQREQSIELRKLSMVAEQNPGIVVITNVQGKITYVNKTFVDITGYAQEEVIGKSANILKSGFTSQDEYGKLWETITAGGTWTGDLLNRKKNGEMFWIHSVISPIRGADGAIHSFVELAEDVTELKRIQAEAEEERKFADTLRSFIAAVNRSPVLEEVLGLLLESIEPIIPYDAASVMLVNGGVATITMTRGFEHWGLEEWIKERRYRLAETPLLTRMLQDQRPLILDNISDYVNEHPELPAELKHLPSYLGTPIHAGDYLVGFINLNRFFPNAYTPQHAERLEAFASQVATAIQNARLFEELESYTGILVEAVENRTGELKLIKDRVEAILNNSPDAILVLGKNGKIETSNPAGSRLLKYEMEELFDLSLAQLCIDQNSRVITEALEKVKKQGGSSRIEVTAQRKDGKTFDAELALAPISNDGFQGEVVCSLRDITALKEVARLKDAFVSNVSHELRTPITGLKLNHRLLERDQENGEVYRERLGREIDRLNDLIEDLLRLSRLDAGRVTLNLEKIHLNKLVEDIAQDRGPLAVSRGQTLNYKLDSADLQILADPGLLIQAISVLVTNALNYTPKEGQIALTTQTRVESDKEWLGVSIIDSGPGVSEEDRSHLFERFYRGQSGRASGVPGTGLGLAICHEIVALHKGRIEVESKGMPGEGSSFTIWIPATEGHIQG